MVEYKLFKLRTTSTLKTINKGLNKLAEEGWLIEFFNSDWIILARIKEKEEKDGDNEGSRVDVCKRN